MWWDDCSKCRCACANHPRHPNVLAKVGGLVFALALGFIVLRCQRLGLGIVVGTVWMTTMAYHTTHSPALRVIDVLAVHSLVLLGTYLAAMQCCGFMRLLSLSCLMIVYICNNHGLDSVGRMPLERHVFVHTLGAFTCCLIAAASSS